jgi:hypothetical protein
MKTQHFVMVCTTRWKTSRKISTIQLKYRRKGKTRYSKIICSGVVTNATGTAYPSRAPEFTPVFSGIGVAQSLFYCVVFCRWLFVLLSFFVWPLYCLYIRVLITSSLSSNLAYRLRNVYVII